MPKKKSGSTEPEEKLTAKKAAKKAPKKKAPAKKVAAKKQVKSFSMTDLDNVRAMKQALLASPLGSKKNAAGYMSLKDFRPSFIPFGDFIFEALTSIKGWVAGDTYELIGADGVGKSSLVLHWIGNLLRQDVPTYLLLSQNKVHRPEWIRRCLSSDRDEAELLYENMFVDKVFTMVEAIERVDLFCKKMRREFPQFHSKPIGVFIDSFGFLQPPDMAAGYVEYGSGETKKSKFGKSTAAVKTLESLPNMTAARLAHLWKQRLQFLLWRYNAFLVIVEDQTTLVDMKTSSLPVFMQPKEDHNRSKRGGRALNQCAALQFVLSEHGAVKEDKVEVGRRARLSVVKSNYGEKHRFFDFTLRNKNYADTATYQQRVIDLSIPTVEEVIMQCQPFGAIKTNDTYSSAYLGLNNATALEVMETVAANPEIVEWLGKALNIYGYSQGEEATAFSMAPEDMEEREGSFEDDVQECLSSGEGTEDYSDDA